VSLLRRNTVLKAFRLEFYNHLLAAEQKPLDSLSAQLINVDIEKNFYPPLDIVDGMARIYDPIVCGLENMDTPIYGYLFYQRLPTLFAIGKVRLVVSLPYSKKQCIYLVSQFFVTKYKR
jgi:hypothetical protein